MESTLNDEQQKNRTPQMSELPTTCKEFRQACENCSLAKLCLPVSLAPQEMESLNSIIKKRLILERGKTLFNVGDSFSKLYAVHSGSFKAIMPTYYGKEQITSFYLPGELMGFDAIQSDQHQVNAIALETSSVCEIPFNGLLQLAGNIPNLQRQLIKIMSHKFNPDSNVNLNSNADERVASLLLALSSRFAQRGFSAVQFNLSMSRQDMANYLGLATETVSRIFTQMQEEKILQVNRKEIHILDFRQLQVRACVKVASE